MSLERGKRYALIGSSGSGKSTLLRVLAGLYEAERIVIDRSHAPAIMCPIEAARLLRNTTTLIPQDAEVLEATLAENLALCESLAGAPSRDRFARGRRQHARAGYFERAGRGTLFLDEAAEMPLDMQVKLLRALESRSICRVGGDRPIPLHARVIAATNRHVPEAVSHQQLRADLLYRLAVFHIETPPLRQRGADIGLLARHFLDRLNAAEGTSKRLSLDSVDNLYEHRWPGNVRELRNTIQRAFILADVELDLRRATSCGLRFEVRGRRP